jgi:hypothetical protein
MNVWKIGSRWSEDGHWGSSILDIFWKYGVVFVGGDSSSLFLQAKDGDLVAIADGYSIVGVGKLLGAPKLISELNLKFSFMDRQRVDLTANDVIACKIKLLEVPEKIRHWYEYRKKICQIKQPDLIEKISRQWDELICSSVNKPFLINAKTKTLKDLLEDKTVKQYIVPVFQRPYAWGPREIEKFVGDIIRATQKNEPIFVGTIQLSDKHLLSPRGYYFQEVIDGQQRLTTCALILKVLRELEPSNQYIKAFVREFDWLESRVSNGAQQELLDNAICSEISEKSSNGNNPYIDNCYQVKKILESYCEPKNIQNGEDEGYEEQWQLDVPSFFNHLTENIHFVVIETRAGLSKTLQIFNTINTAGLDLNGADLFKVRAFEYLKDHHGFPECCFDDISTLYEKIDRKNREFERPASSINEILRIYQTIIIGRSKLPVALNRFGTETFYERLFDGLFGLHQWENFHEVSRKDHDVRLIHLEDIGKLIEDRFYFENEYHDPDSPIVDINTKLAFRVIEWGRYDEYWHLWHVFRFRYQNEPGLEVKSREFIQAVAKLFMVFSVRYAKKVIPMHSFIAMDVVRSMFESGRTMDEVIKKIQEKCLCEKDAFRKTLTDDSFAGSPVQKNLLCRLLEWLARTNPDCAEQKEIFRGGYDIEHIQAYHDYDEKRRAEIWQEWDKKINGLGNLMLLEYDINRSIGNNPFTDKRKAYKDQSKLTVPKKIADKDEWNLAAATEKLERDVKAIMEYVYDAE